MSTRNLDAIFRPASVAVIGASCRPHSIGRVRLKPVVAIKTGRHQRTAQAAASHTGALAGIDEVYDAAFRRAGVLRVRDIDEVFDAAETLASPPPINGDRARCRTASWPV